MKKVMPGLLYFYIHFATEVLCFYFLTKVTGDNFLLWTVAFLYDALAFVPQIIIGKISDYAPKIPLGAIGIILLCLGLIISTINSAAIFLSLVIICLGNCCVHIAGAEVTLRAAKGKLSPSAIFVAGGSFGVITGKLLAESVSFYIILLIIILALPLVFIAEKYRKETTNDKNPCRNFNYTNQKMSAILVIILMVLVVAIRGYIGYGIPTSWNKSVFETVLLYVSMGIGKALGGILADKIGLRKTTIIATIGALPFLIFGDNIMIVSLIGVALFSMTMPLTLALLVSVLQKNPGVAFGLTTVGLFLGTAPVFFLNFPKGSPGILIITFTTFICTYLLLKVIRKETNDKKN